MSCAKCHVPAVCNIILYKCDLLHNTHTPTGLDSHSHHAAGEKKQRPSDLNSSYLQDLSSTQGETE